MRILIIILITLVGFTSNLHAQSSLTIGFQVSPSLSRIIENYYYPGYQYQSSLNYGATFAFEKKKWGISSGFFHQKMGSKFEVEKSTTSLPGGTQEFYDVNIYIRSIALPLRLYYKFPLSSHFTISPNVGIMPGYIYSQTFEVPEFTVVPPYEAITDLVLFNQVSVAAFTGISLSQTINAAWSVEVLPGFSYQFGNPIPDFDKSSRPVLVAFSVEFGVKYKLR